MEFTPSLILAMWAGGLAASVAAVAWWRVVGPGYVWLGSGVVILLGVTATLAGAGPAAVVGSLLAAAGAVVARSPAAVTPLLAAGSVAFVVAAAMNGPVLGAITGAILLGGVTGAMILGHWFLVDPRLPRWALRRLDAVGATGAVIDLGALLLLGALPWATGDLVVGVGFLLLAVTTAVLMVMVWFALGEEGYSGVMAATGLSYLATLTAIGAAVVGRLLLDGPVLGG